MATKFHKGQDLVCIHYKDLPLVTVDSINGKEVWVIEHDNGRLWWGPASWFRAIPIVKRKKIRPIRKPKTPKKFVVTGLATEGSLCDSGIPGCSCNQSASVALYNGRF